MDSKKLVNLKFGIIFLGLITSHAACTSEHGLIGEWKAIAAQSDVDRVNTYRALMAAIGVMPSVWMIDDGVIVLKNDSNQVLDKYSYQIKKDTLLIDRKNQENYVFIIKQHKDTLSLLSDSVKYTLVKMR